MEALVLDEITSQPSTHPRRGAITETGLYQPDFAVTNEPETSPRGAAPATARVAAEPATEPTPARVATLEMFARSQATPVDDSAYDGVDDTVDESVSIHGIAEIGPSEAHAPGPGHTPGPGHAPGPGHTPRPGHTQGTAPGQMQGSPHGQRISGRPSAPAGAPSGKRQAMTVIAGQGLDLAERFNVLFADSLPGWRAELAEPVGPSTSGGDQAQQAISLISADGQERIAVGRVDPARRTVAVRSLDIVRVMYERRFGRSLPLGNVPYERFMEQLGHFFAPISYAVTREMLPPVESIAPSEPERRMGVVTYALMALVVAVVALLIYAVVAFRM